MREANINETAVARLGSREYPRLIKVELLGPEDAQGFRRVRDWATGERLTVHRDQLTRDACADD